MALPTKATIESAIANLEDIATEDKTQDGAESLFRKIKEMTSLIQDVYPSTYKPLAEQPSSFWSEYANVPNVDVLDVSLNDATDATITAALAVAGELGVANGAAMTGSEIFEVDGVADTTDNALQAAKGSAVASGDRFYVTSATAVFYLGAF